MNTQGIILRKYDFRESDSFFSVYTLDGGKIEAIARGVKKPKTKLGGHLDFFSIIDIRIAKGKIFNHIAGAVERKIFLNIKEDLNKINLSFYCLEVTNHFVNLEKKDKRIFYLLKEILEILNSEKERKDELMNYQHYLSFSYFYILKLLNLLGYKPEFFNCLKCRKDILLSENNYFDSVGGGVVCEKCKDREMFIISSEAIESLRLILEKELNDLREEFALLVNELQTKELIKIIDKFLTYRLEREIKSRRFIVKNYSR